jgi:hypothetical protein
MSISGLASGFDWKSVVDQLTAVERTPQNAVRIEQSTLAKRRDALGQITSQLNDLQPLQPQIGQFLGHDHRLGQFVQWSGDRKLLHHRVHSSHGCQLVGGEHWNHQSAALSGRQHLHHGKPAGRCQQRHRPRAFGSRVGEFADSRNHHHRT